MSRMTTLKGIFPDPKPIRRKNFIQENVKSLRQMEQYFHNHREIEDLQNLHIHKHQKTHKKYHNVTSKVHSIPVKLEEPPKKLSSKTLTDKEEKSSHSDQKLSVPNLFNKGTTSNKKISKVGFRNFASTQKRPERIRVVNHKSTVVKNKSKAPPESNISYNKSHNEEVNKTEIKYKNQSIQTMDDKNLHNLYAEGIIRYATMKQPCKDVPTEPGKIEKDQTNPPSDRGDCKLPIKCDGDETNYVKLNKQRNTVASKLAAQLNHGVPPPSYRKGVVPKYIRDRKEAIKKEEKAKTDARHPDCPEGHVPLPDEERKETLRMLKKSYQESVNELNKLPIRVDTLRAQRQKMEIEKQLTKLEEGIKVFSRPKVFVKIDA